MEKLVRYSTFDIQREKLVRYSPFDIRFSNGEVSSIFDIQMEKLVRYSIFDIRTAAVDHFIRVKTFFGNRKVTEYQVFHIKLTFNSRF